MTTIVYDGDCGFCQLCIDWFVSNSKPNKFKLEKRKKLTEIIVISKNQKLYGAKGIGYLLKYTKYKVIGDFICCCFVLPFANIVYKIIAKHRSKISFILKKQVCKI
jgi:predicted DCC family thiol-disulfide oxidoreductase YuxK